MKNTFYKCNYLRISLKLFTTQIIQSIAKTDKFLQIEACEYNGRRRSFFSNDSLIVSFFRLLRFFRFFSIVQIRRTGPKNDNLITDRKKVTCSQHKVTSDKTPTQNANSPNKNEIMKPKLIKYRRNLRQTLFSGLERNLRSHDNNLSSINLRLLNWSDVWIS